MGRPLRRILQAFQRFAAGMAYLEVAVEDFIQALFRYSHSQPTYYKMLLKYSSIIKENIGVEKS